MGGVVEKILPRNTTIPAAAGTAYTTTRTTRTGFEMHVVQGERELAADCRSLARFTLEGHSADAGRDGASRGDAFRVDADGLLTSKREGADHGIEQKVEVKPSYGLTDEEVEHMLLDAFDHGEEDVEGATLREERVDAQRILTSLEQAWNAMRSYSPRRGASRHRRQPSRRLKRAVSGEDYDESTAASKTLDQASKDLRAGGWTAASRRLSRARGFARSKHETETARGIEPHLGSSPLRAGSSRNIDAESSLHP